MYYTLKGDHEAIKKHLDEFIKAAKEEYEKQLKPLKKLPGANMAIPPIFEMGYIEKEKYILLWDTNVAPPGLGLLWRRVAYKMSKNLENYFKDQGVKVEAKAFQKKEDVR